MNSLRVVIGFLFFVLVSNSFADQKRYSLDTVLGTLAEKFKGQMLSNADYSKIKHPKANHYTLAKELKIKALISIPQLVKQGKAVKKTGTAGQPGYLITYLEPGSVYHVLGLKVGDFLSKLNGAPLTDDKQIMEIFSKNKNADNIVLELVRQKATMVLFYNFI